MKKQLTKSEWLKSVAKEVRALKKYATEEELSRLDFSQLNPDDGRLCIYGQMTGHCNSLRAVFLIHKSCEFFTINKWESVADLGHFDTSKENITTGIKESRTDVDINYFSSLEHYTELQGAKNKNVIKFLKGETETLEL